MRNSPMCLTHKGDGFIHFFCIYHVLRAWHKRPLGKCSSTVTLTALSTPLLSCQLPWSVLLHYKSLISFNVLRWVLSGRHCICESFLSVQRLCQWPQFSGVRALAGIGYWIPPVILMSMGGGLWSQPSVSYPGLCLRRRPRGSFCITHTANVLLGSPHFWTTFKSFSWLTTLTFWLDFFFLNNKALHSHREAIVQGDTYRSSIHSAGSWDCAGPYSFMKLQGNQDE